MALLPGFEYDIFISYRHNDNLDGTSAGSGQGWVTDFVQNLEKELKGTIKDNLTIYFDKNPHDGLLETHSVDKSLEGKLKCLIFIPIISQTYCDPKSFAWQHEFCAFNRLAKEDAFGRDVKVSGGNVASRILPVKIHDIDAEDKALLENEMGGVLRPVEFIYKEAGVNRPLTLDDKEEKNLNGTKYRNQVNKMANAIKDLITSLKNPVNPSTTAAKTQHPTPNAKPLSLKTVSLITLGVMVFMALIYTASQFRGSSDKEPEIIDKSIAVLPFTDMSPGKDQEYLGDGVAEEVINVLAQSRDLRVIGRTSSFQFKGKNLDLRKIGDSLGVAYVLEGSVRKAKDQLRITAQLIKTSDGSHIWSKAFDRTAAEDFNVQDDIAYTVSNSLQASLLRENNSDQVKKARNPEAYDLYLQGRFFLNQRGDGLTKGLALFKQSIALDSAFAPAYAGIAGCYAFLSFYKFIPTNEGIEESKKWAAKAIALDPGTAQAYYFQGFVALYMEYKWMEAEWLLKKSLELNPNDAYALSLNGTVANYLRGDYQAAETLCRRAVQQDPIYFLPYNTLGNILLTQKKYEAGLEALRKSIDLNDRAEVGYASFSSALLYMKRADEAQRSFEKGMVLTGRTQLMLISYIEILAAANKPDQVMKVYLEIQELNRSGKAEPYTLGVAAAAVGKADEAFRYFDLALDQHNSGFLNWSPRRLYVPQWRVYLQKDARYKKIMDRLAFPSN